MLAQRRETNLPRGSHGHLLSEAMDPDNQFAYDVEGPVVDWAQAKLDEVQERYKKANPNADTHAMHWTVKKRD